MEIHAHTHTADPDPSTSSGHRGRKKWTHYLWEFLMLFLAVYCGFLAENLREDNVEKHREKEIIVSLVEDLKKDTTLLNDQLMIQKQNKITMDSLVILLTAPDIKKGGAELYYYSRKIFRFTFLRYTDRTIQQLKNAGSFRLIKSNKVADSILKYYFHLDRITDLQNQAQERVIEFIISGRPVFDPLVFESMVNDQTENDIIKPLGNPLLLTYEKSRILNLISIIHNLKSGNRVMQKNYIDLKLQAAELIGFLKSEYHIKK